MMAQQVGRLAKTTLTYGLGQVVLRFINLLLLPLFTAYLTPTEYGVSAILGLLAFVVTPIFSLGLNTAIGMCYFETDDPERKEATIWTAFAILAVSTAPLALLGTVFARPISVLALQTPDYHHLVRLTTVSVILGIIVIPFMLYLQLEERATTYVAITVVVGLASIGLSVLTVVVLRRGLLGVVEAGVISQGLTFALFLLSAARRLKMRLSWPLVRSLLRLGVPLIPSFAFVFVILQGNKYILQWFGGLDAVGIYSIGFNIGMVMNLAVVAFTTAWSPYFLSFSDRQAEARVLFGRILTYYVFGFGALSLLFYIAAKPLVMIMTQPAFHDAYVVVGPSATAQFLIGAVSLLLPAMFFAQEVRFLTPVRAMAAVLAVVGNLMLIPAFGILGAAIALVVGTLAMVVLQQAWNFTRQDYLAIVYQWDRVLKFGACYLLYAVVLLWNRPLSLRDELVLSGIAAATLPLVLYLLLGPADRLAFWTLGKQWVLRRWNAVMVAARA